MKGREKAIEDLGIYDRFNAKMMITHIQGFYDGDVSPQQFKDGMEKVHRYITEVEAVAKRVLNKP